MTDTDRQKCDEWLRAHAKHWQTYRRGDWHYRWKGKTLVRYLDNVSMRELQDGLVLEYLCSPDCMPTLSLYSQDVPPEWTPVNSWYESMPMRPSNTGMAQVRLYHALKTDVEEGGDGPYSVENGCMWKVTWKYFWKQTEVADLPESSSGVNYQIRNLTRDDEDGTFSYMLERRERVQQDIPEFLRETDKFADRYHEEHLGVKGDTSLGGKPASFRKGSKTTRTVRKNEDCTHDVNNERVDENSVPGAVTETHVTLRGKTRTTVNRGMPEKAPEESAGVGGSVRNEMTETGLWNQTISEKLPGIVGTIREGCTRNLFRHEHSSTEVKHDDPGFGHVTDVTQNPGEVVEQTVVHNDDDTYDLAVTKRTDRAVQDAEVSVRKTLDGVVRSVTNRNQSEPLPTENLPVGARVTNRRTESNLYDVTKETVTPENVGTTGEGCLKNAHEHRHSTTSTTGTRPQSVDTRESGGGTIYEKSVQMTDSGAFRVTSSTREAKNVTATSNGGTSSRSVSSTSHVNARSEQLGAPSPAKNQEVDVSSSRNEFGLYNGSVRVVTHSPVQSQTEGGSPLASETTVVSEFSDVQPAMTPYKGVIYGVSAAPNEMGTFRSTVTTRVAHQKMLPSQEAGDGDFQEVRWIDVRRSRTSIVRYQNRIVIFRNCKQAPAIVKENENESVNVDVHINEFELLDGRYIFSLFLGEEYVEGGGGGAGEQESETLRVTRSRVVQFIWKNDYGDKSIIKRRYSRDFTIRYLISSRQNMLMESIRGDNFPEYGLYSRMHGWYATIVHAVGEESYVEIEEPVEE